jgi:hypothetical protein
MAVKLFHSTGFPSQLRSGEARHGKHPATLVALASLWLALACNVAVWRLLAGTTADARLVLASVLMVAGGSGFFFSVLGWRRTIKLRRLPADQQLLSNFAGACAGVLLLAGGLLLLG